jgi:non-ribosomal peptide synthetase component F
MTYHELDDYSTRLAGHLVQIGIEPENIVPLCFEKSMWTIVAMLAVLKAGGAFAPLDPEHPPSRHKEIFRQTKAKVVLTSAQYFKLWADSTCTIITVNKVYINQLPSDNSKIISAANAHNSVYVIFTSGSTGVPKGVLIEHRSVSTNYLAQEHVFRLTPQTTLP